MLIESRSHPRVFLEYLSEIGVADTKLLGNILYRQLFLKGVADKHLCLAHNVHVLSVLAQFIGSLERVHKPNEVVDDSCKSLL